MNGHPSFLVYIFIKIKIKIGIGIGIGIVIIRYRYRYGDLGSVNYLSAFMKDAHECI